MSSEQQLKEMLAQAELPIRASYRPGEVCKLLGITSRTLYTLTERYELDPETNTPVRPDSLDSFLLASHRRIRYSELMAYIERNNTYHRRNALSSRQLRLFDS